MALVDAARAVAPRPLIVASVRDILACPAKPERIEEAHRRLGALYDAVLVHGDPNLVPLERSWPLSREAAALVRYTGYVDEGGAAVAEPTTAKRSEILVSGGSSAASLPLYRAALAAAASVTERPWRVVVGAGVAQPAFEDLRRSRARPCRRRARPSGLPGAAGASRGLGEPGRLQHRRRSSARRRRGRAGAFRGRPRDRAAPARRMSRRARPRPAAAGSRARARDPRRTRPDAACGRGAAATGDQARRRRTNRRPGRGTGPEAAPSRGRAASCRLVAARRCAPPHRRRRPDRRNLVARRRCRRRDPGARSVARGGTRV